MKAISKMTQAEVAAFVQSHLRKHKIYMTLSGGATTVHYIFFVTIEVLCCAFIAGSAWNWRNVDGHL